MDFAKIVRERMKTLGWSRGELLKRLKGKVGKTALYDFLWEPPYIPPPEKPPKKPPRRPIITYVSHDYPPPKHRTLPKRLPPAGINSKSLEHILEALDLTVTPKRPEDC